MTTTARLLITFLTLSYVSLEAMQEQKIEKQTNSQGSSGGITPTSTTSPGLRPIEYNNNEDSEEDIALPHLEETQCTGPGYCKGNPIEWHGFISRFSCIQIRELPQEFHWLPKGLLVLTLGMKNRCKKCINTILASDLNLKQEQIIIPFYNKQIRERICGFLKDYPNIHLSSYNVHHELVEIFNNIRSQLFNSGDLNRGSRNDSFLKRYSQTPF